MGTKTVLVLECDIGAHLDSDAKTFSDCAAALKDGWKLVNFPGVKDRSQVERVICPDCWKVLCKATEQDINRYGNK